MIRNRRRIGGDGATARPRSPEQCEWSINVLGPLGSPLRGRPLAPKKDGLTLIELLGVIVIVSLVAGVATMGLASTTHDTRVRAAAAQWRDLDAKARLFGRTLGPVVMTLNADRTAVRVHVNGSDELLTKVVLPVGVTGRISAEPGDDAIVFDRLGHSLDYDVQLSTDGRIFAWRVYGLTGLIQEPKR